MFNRIRRGNHITRERITKHAIYYIAKQRGKQVGVNIMPHDFRRSFITRVIEEYDVSIAQKLAHHANIATTVSYDVMTTSGAMQLIVLYCDRCLPGGLPVKTY